MPATTEPARFSVKHEIYLRGLLCRPADAAVPIYADDRDAIRAALAEIERLREELRCVKVATETTTYAERQELIAALEEDHDRICESMRGEHPSAFEHTDREAAEIRQRLAELRRDQYSTTK